MILNGRVINPGELRTKVVLQSRTFASQAGGFQAPTWATAATVWCRWTGAHGSEVWAAQAVEASQPATVLIRYRLDVDLTYSLTLDGIRYEIVSVDDIQQRHEYMELKVQRMAVS